jgi:Restriction endonuclease S subunits
MNFVEFVDKGILFLRNQDIKNNFIETGNSVYIDDATYLKLSLKLDENDLLITRVGSLGSAAIVSKEHLPCTANQNIAQVKLQLDKVAPYYVSTYLNSKYAYSLISGISTGNVQQWLNLENIGNLLIPIFSRCFQEAIQQIILHAHRDLKEASEQYSKAETILLTHLDLINYNPICRQVSIKLFSQSYGESGRLDAEYYHPQYDELFERLERKAICCCRVKDIAEYNTRGLQPEYVQDGTLRVINSQHILEQGLNYDGFDRTNIKNWTSQAKARVFQYDILTYTTGANVGRTSTYLENYPALASNHVNIVRLHHENPVYIGFVMNSIIGRMQTRRLITGSAQAELYPTDIDQFLIPLIDVNAQKEIVRCVLEAHRAKKSANKLLEISEKAVELAIEHDEEIAMKWLADKGGR